MQNPLFPLLTLAILGTSPLFAAPAAVVIEAETAAEIEAPMVIVSADRVPPGTEFVAGASEGRYLEIPEKAGNPPKLEAGMARFEIEVPADGKYTLWARVYWEGECSNSFTVQVNDAAPFLLGDNATYKSWHWIKYPVSRMIPPLDLAKGRHVILIENREDGVRLDQLALSAHPRFRPVGIEPPNARGDAAQ